MGGWRNLGPELVEVRRREIRSLYARGLASVGQLAARFDLARDILGDALTPKRRTRPTNT